MASQFLVKVKSNLQISIYLYWFHGQEFIHRLTLYTNSKSACCFRRVSTLLFRCQRLIQDPCIIWDGYFVTTVDDLNPVWRTEVALASLLAASACLGRIKGVQYIVMSKELCNFRHSAHQVLIWVTRANVVFADIIQVKRQSFVWWKLHLCQSSTIWQYLF